MDQPAAASRASSAPPTTTTRSARTPPPDTAAIERMNNTTVVTSKPIIPNSNANGPRNVPANPPDELIVAASPSRTCWASPRPACHATSAKTSPPWIITSITTTVNGGGDERLRSLLQRVDDQLGPAAEAGLDRRDEHHRHRDPDRHSTASGRDQPVREPGLGDPRCRGRVEHVPHPLHQQQQPVGEPGVDPLDHLVPRPPDDAADGVAEQSPAGSGTATSSAHPDRVPATTAPPRPRPRRRSPSAGGAGVGPGVRRPPVNQPRPVRVDHVERDGAPRLTARPSTRRGDDQHRPHPHPHTVRRRRERSL